MSDVAKSERPLFGVTVRDPNKDYGGPSRIRVLPYGPTEHIVGEEAFELLRHSKPKGRKAKRESE